MEDEKAGSRKFEIEARTKIQNISIGGIVCFAC